MQHLLLYYIQATNKIIYMLGSVTTEVTKVMKFYILKANFKISLLYEVQ